MSHLPQLQNLVDPLAAHTHNVVIDSEFSVGSSDFQLRHYSSLAAICLLVLEYIGTCRFEFTYIWRRPVTASKVAFVVSRYFELVGNVAHYSLIHIVLGRSPYGISPARCAAWYTLLSAQCTVMMISLDTILFLRVYALYRKKAASLLLGLPLLVPWIIGAYLNWVWVVNRQHYFDGLCNVSFRGISAALVLSFSVCFIISHLLLCVSAYLKRNVGQGQVPVVRLVVHEGTWVFVILFAIVAATAPADAALKVFNPFYHFVCPPTLVSILTCRIIQNMHSLGVARAEQEGTQCDEDEFRLTTFITTETWGMNHE